MREVSDAEIDEVLGRHGQMVPSRDLRDGDVFKFVGGRHDGKEEICRGREWGYVQYEGGPWNEFDPDSMPEVEYVGRATRILPKPRPPIVLFGNGRSPWHADPE